MTLSLRGGLTACQRSLYALCPSRPVSNALQPHRCKASARVNAWRTDLPLLARTRSHTTGNFLFHQRPLSTRIRHFRTQSVRQAAGHKQEAETEEAKKDIPETQKEQPTYSSELSKYARRAQAVRTEQGSLTLLQRFRLLWRRYWYIVIPVHIVTSVSWFGGFYFASVSGVDVIGFLEWIHMPESWVDVMKKNPSAGHVAVAYTLYKTVTPARYAVTIGGTHVTMRVLSQMGLIPTTKEVRTQVDAYTMKKRKQVLLERARLRVKYTRRLNALRVRWRTRRRLFLQPSQQKNKKNN